MRKHMELEEERPRGTWSNGQVYVLALVCLVSGLLLGYLFRGSSPLPAAASSISAGAPREQASMPSPDDLSGSAAAAQEALKKNPNDVDALIQLGNLSYDHQAWEQAIEYYRRALERQPDNVNVRTDLGTAYWQQGKPESAVAEYEKSLKINPTHANTLLNLGVVKWQGLKDSKGAVAVWKKLLETNPDFKDRSKVEILIQHAESGRGVPQ